MTTYTRIMLGCLAVVAAGVCGSALIVAPDVTVEFICTGPVSPSLPTWHVNGRVAVTKGNCYRLTIRRAAGINATAILTINGNHNCDTFNIYCRIYRDSQFLHLHSTTLIVQGRLPSPEGVITNKHFNSSTIEWRPPYNSSINIDTISVDPHITQYTVYITDNYTGNIVTENITETRFSSKTSEDCPCPMYQVSAWNAGGEGELSEPLQRCIPLIPHKIAAGNVITHTTASQVLHVHLHVAEPCEVRRPNSLHITVMTSDRVAVNTTAVHHDHQSGPQVVIRIKLPQNVDMCSLLVKIRAENNAGTSTPTEIEVECPTVRLDTTSTTGFVTDAIPSVVTGSISSVVTEAKQGDNITTTGIIIAVIAVIGVVLIMAATFGIICCRRVHRKDGLKKSEIEMKPNQAYETVTRPQPATQVHTEPDYEDVVQVYH